MYKCQKRRVINVVWTSPVRLSFIPPVNPPVTEPTMSGQYYPTVREPRGVTVPNFVPNLLRFPTQWCRFHRFPTESFHLEAIFCDERVSIACESNTYRARQRIAQTGRGKVP